MTRDGCFPSLTWTTDLTAGTITAVTLSALDNTCTTAIPVTFPGSVTSTQGFTTEQIGSGVYRPLYFRVDELIRLQIP